MEATHFPFKQGDWPLIVLQLVFKTRVSIRLCGIIFVEN